MSDVLERAIEAARRTPIAEDPRTLGRIHASLARGPSVRRSLGLAAAAALVAVVIGGPTAWAWTSGRIADWLGSAAPPPSSGPPPSAPARTAEPRRRATAEREPSHAPAPTPSPDTSASPVAERVDEPPSRSRTASVPASGRQDIETLEFRDAHRAHFERRDFAVALEGWDLYLEHHPDGRYLPEARYNRALALVHLGRLNEARDALRRFADAAPGAYRQAEAAALVQALDERIAARGQ